MAASYRDLLLETEPEVIETPERYRAIAASFSALLRKKRLKPQEAKLEQLLGLLIQDYDRRHALPPADWTPAAKLEFLIRESGRSSGDLIPVFGNESRLTAALRGTRPIDADEARALGKLFHLSPGIFI